MQLCLRSFALGLPFGSMLMLTFLVILATVRVDRQIPGVKAEFEKAERLLDQDAARG